MNFLFHSFLLAVVFVDRTICLPKCRVPKVISVLIDGCRWNYIENKDLPGFQKLAKRGTHASYVTPIFPSNSYPNWYSFVTGAASSEEKNFESDLEEEGKSTEQLSFFSLEDPEGTSAVYNAESSRRSKRYSYDSPSQQEWCYLPDLTRHGLLGCYIWAKKKHCTLKCLSGFHFEGHDTVNFTCFKTEGQWDKSPQCSPISEKSNVSNRRKRSDEIPHNSWCMLGNMRRFGDLKCNVWSYKKMCNLKCYKGFQIDGSDGLELTCERKIGTWKQLLKCSRIEGAEGDSNVVETGNGDASFKKDFPDMPLPEKISFEEKYGEKGSEEVP